MAVCQRVVVDGGCVIDQIVFAYVLLCHTVCVGEYDYSRLYSSRSGDCLSDPLRSD